MSTESSIVTESVCTVNKDRKEQERYSPVDRLSELTPKDTGGFLNKGFLQTTLTLDGIFYSARQQSIYFQNVLFLLSYQIHNDKPDHKLKTIKNIIQITLIDITV